MAALDRDVLAEVQRRQSAAADDDSAQVWVVAGPGAGKSKAIVRRVEKLLRNEVPAEAIGVISFTNASVRDLTESLARELPQGLAGRTEVKVRTLHSLAFRLLHAAGQLKEYPTTPRVLSNTDLREIVDNEFQHVHGLSRARVEAIRQHYETVAATNAAPPPYRQPEEPVTNEELASFGRHLRRRRELFSAILQGELVKQAVEKIGSNALQVELLGLRHVIVDEYQDLNPVDAQFIDQLVAADIVTLVVGDDDQSVYSFRHATPDGFRSFPNRNDGTARHEFGHCFRCSPAVLDAAQTIINEYAADGRIDKTFASVWDTSTPRVGGVMSRVAYASDDQEARGIAEACLALIDNGLGLAPQKIAILFAIRRLGTLVERALDECGIPFLPLNQPQLDDSSDGRAGHALLKAICDEDDLVSRRVVFGSLGGVGIQSCVDLVDKSFSGAISAKQVWTVPDASAVYSQRVETARRRVVTLLDAAREAEVNPDSCLQVVLAAMEEVVRRELGGGVPDALRVASKGLPTTATVGEFLALHALTTIDEVDEFLSELFAKHEEERPAVDYNPCSVRLLTLHGSKGLTFDAVFIPGVEEGVLPSANASLVPQLVEEAARLLFVGITRARAATFLSWARKRGVSGALRWPQASRFLVAEEKFDDEVTRDQVAACIAAITEM